MACKELDPCHRSICVCKSVPYEARDEVRGTRDVRECATDRGVLVDVKDVRGAAINGDSVSSDRFQHLLSRGMALVMVS